MHLEINGQSAYYIFSGIMHNMTGDAFMFLVTIKPSNPH